MNKKNILEFIDVVNKLRHKSENKKKENSFDFLNNFDMLENFDKFNFEISPPNQKKIFYREKVPQKKGLFLEKKLNSDLLDLIDKNYNDLKQYNIFISYKKRLVEKEITRVKKLKKEHKNYPLFGKTLIVKDLMAVEGYRLTRGSKYFNLPISEYDAENIVNLKKAGAIIIGTANLHELAYGVTSKNPHFGFVRNPKFPELIAGGSSGGSAAAIASKLSNIAIGTCTGGSIRQPAACCGVVGFKPSFGSINMKGVIPLALSLDHVGPLADSVEDIFNSHISMTKCNETINKNVTIKIIKPKNFFFDGLDKDFSKAFEKLLSLLSKFATIKTKKIQYMDHAPGAQFITINSEAFSFYKNYLNKKNYFGKDVSNRLQIGKYIMAHDYIKAQSYRSILRKSLDSILSDGEILITPTIPVKPPNISDDHVIFKKKKKPLTPVLTRFTSPFNLSGSPVISIPFFLDNNDFPISFQLVGAFGSDFHLLSVAKKIEEIIKKH